MAFSEDKNPKCPRPQCRKSLGESRNFEVTTCLRDEVIASQPGSDREVSLALAAQGRKRKGGTPVNPRGRGDDFLCYQPREKRGNSLLEEADRIPDVPLLMSAKLRGVCEVVEEWQRAAPKDKIISTSANISA